jgi:hypothetical protein
MKKTKSATCITDPKIAQALLRDTGRVLKVKTGLKGGVLVKANLKATPILF